MHSLSYYENGVLMSRLSPPGLLEPKLLSMGRIKMNVDFSSLFGKFSSAPSSVTGTVVSRSNMKLRRSTCTISNPVGSTCHLSKQVDSRKKAHHATAPFLFSWRAPAPRNQWEATHCGVGVGVGVRAKMWSGVRGEKAFRVIPGRIRMPFSGVSFRRRYEKTPVVQT